MPRPGNLRSIAAAAFAAAALTAIGGGAAAVATTPPPVQTPAPTQTASPTPLPTPSGPTPRPTAAPGTICNYPPILTPPATVKPVPPLRIDTVTETSVGFFWNSPEGCYTAPTTLKVLLNGTPVATTSTGVSGSETLTGLTPGTDYALVVSIVGANGQERSIGSISVRTAGVAPTPTPLPAQDFSVAGSTTLRAKTAAGSFRLAGSSSLTSAPGATSGQVQLAPTTGTLLVAGAFPAQAKLTFGPGQLNLPITATPTAPLTAPLTITKVTLLGLTLTQGGTCRTIKPITATLVPAGTFGLATGGILSGTYSPGGFTGCGALGSFLGATGTKSSISLKLTPTAPTPAPTPSPVPIP